MIGINTVSSQSGRAYFADYLKNGYAMLGYVRSSEHGRAFAEAVLQSGGIYLERPQNRNREKNEFLPLGKSKITDNLTKFVAECEVIILAEPSHYFVQSVAEMIEAGLLKYRVPLVLSPSRTFAAPYLWKLLGEGYPIACFSTCAYSCKAPADNVSYIKRRKRNWVVSLEGAFRKEQIQLLQKLFPQAIINHVPATTSLGNVGAVLHPAVYLLNYDEIMRCRAEKRAFSFYMDGIAGRLEVGETVERIDQMRLQIAAKLGCPVFGLKEDSKEELWAELTARMRSVESTTDGDIYKLRCLRRESLQILHSAVTSCQHWLDYTYGVKRIPGETISEAVRRTPTYQKNSVPQDRYVEEDIPTGLIPLRSLAVRFGIDTTAVDEVLALYHNCYGTEEPAGARTLEEFDTEYIIDYLHGNYFEIKN